MTSFDDQLFLNRISIMRRWAADLLDRLDERKGIPSTDEIQNLMPMVKRLVAAAQRLIKEWNDEMQRRTTDSNDAGDTGA